MLRQRVLAQQSHAESLAAAAKDAGREQTGSAVASIYDEYSVGPSIRPHAVLQRLI